MSVASTVGVSVVNVLQYTILCADKFN